jgi:hypothetical protein
MRLGPSLLPGFYSGRSTRHRPAAAESKQRLAFRIGTVQIHGLERRPNAQQFSRALEHALRAALGATSTNILPARKYKDLVSEVNMKANASAVDVAERLATLMARTLSEETRGGKP